MAAWDELNVGDRERGRLPRGGAVVDEDVDGDKEARRRFGDDGFRGPPPFKLDIVGAGRAVDGMGSGLGLTLPLTGDRLLARLAGEALLDLFAGASPPPFLALMSLWI